MIPRLRALATPFVFLAVLVAGFGLLIPVLGFYWDDWPVILTGRLYGAPGYVEFYQYDRPVSAWTYIVTFPVLGSRPINWHIFSLLLRWGTTVAMWWTLLRLWPARRAEVTWAALLFAVYPVFTQQAISVAYSQHWICYLLFFVSLGAMVQAQRSSPGWFWPFTIFSAATTLAQLLTMEYFAGLELVRPLILWFLVSERPAGWRARAWATLRLWLPYLLTLVGFVIWRLFFLKFPGEQANPPILLYRILETPLAGLVRFFELFIQDTVHLLLTVWANTFTAASFDLQNRFNLFSWAIAALATALVAAFLHFSGKKSRQPDQEAATWAADDRAWPRQILLVGAAGLALGMLPVWLTDRQIIAGAYSDRFGLAAMFGASLLVIGLLSTLVRLPVQRLVLVSMLVGLAVGLHLRIGNDYRWTWVKQTRFYWQFSWRAPGLVSGTPIFSDGEIFKSVGIYSTSMAINLLYPLTETEGQLPYWFSSLGREFLHDMDEFSSGVGFSRGLRFYQFGASTHDGIVIYYEPDKHTCLNILAPEDALVTDLPAITRTAAVNSNLGRILDQPLATGYPPVEIFGPEPSHTSWCYFFQKGALAWQTQDWAQVVALGDEAQQQGYGPLQTGSNTPLEWLPFIEGYARSGRWQDAQGLSLASYERDKRIDARLCRLWNRLAGETGAGPERDAAIRVVHAAAACPAP